MDRSVCYLLDFFVPNEGEPDTALEIGVLCWDMQKPRPQVYVHSLIKPRRMARVRWSNAADQGIERRTIESQTDLPTLLEIKNADLLSRRRVVCMNTQLEPWRSMVEKADTSYSLLNLWQETFYHNEEAAGLETPEQMLEFIGLSAEDTSNTRYTPLLKRLFAMAAVWQYVSMQRDEMIRNQNPEPDMCVMPLSPCWPLPQVEEKWFEGNPESLKDIPEEQLNSFFSENIGDRLDWSLTTMFAHDWVLKRRAGVTEVSQLNNRVAMAEYLFTHVLDFRMQLWVLIYYCLYNKKYEYARQIVLNSDDFRNLPTGIKEDFSTFLITHLGDFLDEEQKITLLRSMIHQCIEEKAGRIYIDYDFDKLSRDNQKDGGSSFIFRELTPPGTNCNIKVFKELSTLAEGPVYRRYEISGFGEDREACIDCVNNLFREFMSEAYNPFSLLWFNPTLSDWLSHITGIAGEELRKPPHQNDSEYLVKVRQALTNIIMPESKPWCETLGRRLSEIVTAINSDIDGELNRTFAFLGISVQVVVYTRPRGFLRRLLHIGG